MRTILLFLMIFSGSLRAQESLFITEFMAANSGTLADQDGETSDWLEIYNAGGGTVNLTGWHLTDNPDRLAQWTFPATNLSPGAFLVVFASGKDRAVAGQELHTNFRLDNAGEYLALVRPDGLHVAHEYAPAFPRQLSDVSYGFELTAESFLFVSNGAPVRWRVPLDPAAMPADWAATNFNDTGWSDGLIALGFSGETTTTNFGPLPATVNVAFGQATTQSSTNSSFGPGRAVNGNYTDYTHTLAGANLPATWEVNLGTNRGIERIVLWNRTSNQSRLRDITVQVLDAGGTDTRFTSALLNPENVLGGGVLDVGPTSLSLDLVELTGGLVIGGRVRVSRTPDPDRSGSGGVGTTSEPDTLCMAEVEVFGVPVSVASNGVFAGLIETDVSGVMSNVNATVLLRVPFVIPDEELPDLDALILRMKYDDGFVAYLNGVEIARRNAPATPAWNSVATAPRADSAAVVFEEIDVSPFIPQLREGGNVLAIHGLNVAADDGDFLVLPQLVGQRYHLLPDRYFATPSPGAPNSGGALGVVADTKFSADRGFYDAPFTVTITSATEGAEIRFTTNGSAPSAVNGILYSGPVPISRTTCLRAIASRPGWLPTDVDTHTYVFPGDVLTQSMASAVSRGFPTSWAGTPADYAMDANVTMPYAPQMIPALRSLPSVFMTTSISNLFDPSSGIYSHPLASGVAWERPVSLELIGTNGLTEFQENCGARIQGGIFFRNFSMTRKKSFRVLFKSQYGAGKLRHDLFKEPGAAREFDGLVLRAGANDGYAWGGAGATVQFTRDEFGRRLHLDMGHPSARGMFVHLYLNGLYWGLYNLIERPNEDLSASYLGGEPDEWDACSSGDYKSGGAAAANRWNDFTARAGRVANHADYQALQGNHPDGTRNPALPLYFDKVNYMDYMIANIWGGNWDWPNKNFWFGFNPGPGGTGYKFYMWDFENVMGNNRSRSPLNMVSPRPEVAASWVGLPHYFMRSYTEYRLDFADRVQRHFFNGGLLTYEVLANRYRHLADSIQSAIVAESARWGDDNHTPAYGLTEWVAERDWILHTYLPQRSSIVLNQFRANGMFPSVNAPVFSQFGGAVPAGFNLVITHSNVGGTILYTLDGSDPREPGTGAPRSSAQSYTAPLTLSSPTAVRARVWNNGAWSALVEAVFRPPQDLGALALTEIMYHAPDVGSTNGSEFDFVELMNTGTNTLDLSGLAFTDGIAFTFTNGTLLAPGAFHVLGGNAHALLMKYPAIELGGIFTGKLDNGGETLTLSDPLGQTVFSITYNDKAPWPEAADGTGLSLQRLVVSAFGNEPANWIAAVPTPGLPTGNGDIDGDGLPDAWEVLNGTLLYVPDADDDLDGDGLTNEREYRSGTNPNDPADPLRWWSVDSVADDVTLTFLAASNRTYSVLYTTSLHEGAWEKLTDVAAHATNRMAVITDSAPAGATRFYQLVTPAR